MATKAEKKLLRGASDKLTALQRGALEKLERQGASQIRGLPVKTVKSLLNRKLIDKIGSARVEDYPTFVLTDLGRTILAIRTRKTGAARR